MSQLDGPTERHIAFPLENHWLYKGAAQVQGADSLKAWARSALDDVVKRLPPDERSAVEFFATEMANEEAQERLIRESRIRRIRKILDKKPSDVR